MSKELLISQLSTYLFWDIDLKEIIEMAQRIGDIKILNQTKSILQMVLSDVKVDVVDYKPCRLCCFPNHGKTLRRLSFYL